MRPEAGSRFGERRDRQQRAVRLQREEGLMLALVEPLVDLRRQRRRVFLGSAEREGQRQQHLAVCLESGGEIGVGIVVGKPRQGLAQLRVPGGGERPVQSVV